MIVRAPFSTEQVESLNAYQESGVMHPYTCGAGHGGHVELVATPDGWVCPLHGCCYRQDWAHDWMMDGTWREMLDFRSGAGQLEAAKHLLEMWAGDGGER